MQLTKRALVANYLLLQNKGTKPIVLQSIHWLVQKSLSNASHM